MRLRPLPAPIALLCALLSTACASSPPAILRPEVPASLLQCQPQPAPPPEPIADADLAVWILDLAAAGDDCRGRLARVRGLVGK